MTIKPIRNDEDLHRASKQLEGTFQAPEGTPEADERDVLVTLIEAYENKCYDLGPADPVEAIKFRMEQDRLTWPAPSMPVHMISPGQRRQSAKVRAFAEHLAAATR